MEGLPDQRPRPAQNHDARRGRVHPPLPPARAAERLPPHPPLRPVRQRRSSLQHRARPPIARRARGRARALARRAGQRGRNRFAGAPLPVLRRPDDHCRNLRRRAPRALAITDPDQDRHLMIVAALPAAQRRFSASNRALEQEGDVLTRSALLLQAPRPHTPLASSPSKNPVVFAPTHNNARHRPPKPHQRSVRDPKIPIGRAAPNQTAPFPTRGFLLTRLSDAGPASRTARLQRAASETLQQNGRSRTPARVEPRAPAKGRRPKPFSFSAEPGATTKQWKVNLTHRRPATSSQPDL